MEKLLLLAGIALIVLAFTGMHHSRSQESQMDYVHDLDIDRFMGLWYSIANKPNFIESHCKCSKSLDTRVDDTTITLEESCKVFGKWIKSTSKAIINEPSTGKWTNVQNMFLKGDYWILDVD